MRNRRSVHSSFNNSIPHSTFKLQHILKNEHVSLLANKLSLTLIAVLFTGKILGATDSELLAKTNGIALFNQQKQLSSISFLTNAAEIGDSEAQYYLAQALRKTGHYMDANALSWYEKSAEQGNLYAMIQLGRSGSDNCILMKNCSESKKQPIEWLNLAMNLARSKADQGDAEAMYIMYEVSMEDGWLEKSAAAGYPIAQYLMGIREQQGEGYFLLPGARSKSVLRWFRSASEGGYPKAMISYVTLLYKDGDMEGVRYWLEEAAKTGYQDAVSSYGAYLAHSPDRVGYPLDLVKGYGLLLLLKELDGGGNIQPYVEEKLPEIAKKMTSEQITEAVEFSKTWKATHPPLSFFPDKLTP